MLKRWIALLLMLCMVSGTAAAAAEEAPAGRLPDQTLMTFYRNSLFAGDSLVRMFRNYIKERQKTEPDFFPDIKFYSSYSFQLRLAAKEKTWSGDKANLQYKGRDETLCRIAQKEAPDKLFILAGLNDNFTQNVKGESGPDRGMRLVGKIMELLAQYSPDTQVYFFSLTPVTKAVEKKRHVQEKWNEFNALLEARCRELGAGYIDIATPLKDEEGLLPKNISADGEYHLNDRGNEIWARTLLDYAQAQYEAGAWTPDEGGQGI